MRPWNLALAATLIAPIVAQQWHVTPPSPRSGACMAYDATRSRTILFGGGIPLSQSPRDETFEFDGARWRPSDSVVAPPARSSSEMAFDRVRGRAILFGGYEFGQVFHAFDDTWEYDGSVWARGAVTSPPARPAPRHGHAMAFDGRRGRTVMFGGEVDGERAGDTWEYDGVLWTRIFTANQPPARSGHRLVYDDARQKTVLFGGAITNGRTLTDDTWEYDGVDWMQVVVTAPPVARKDAQMTYDSGRRRTVLFGGFGSLNYTQLDDTWEYDGQRWTQVSVAAHPEARYMGGLVFDIARGRTVLFGGQSWTQVGGTVVFSDTWEYDGIAWTRLPVSDRPATSFPSLAYDTARERILLNGDESGNAWEYGDGAWRRVAASSGSRLGAKMAHDSARGRTVLFGGGGLLGTVADTREFDGVNWHVVSPAASPSPRSFQGMAFVPSRRRVVLFGGVHFSQPLGDTWEYDGVTWRQVITSHSPPARYGYGLCHDTGRDRTVLFGGAVGEVQVWANDTWEYDGVDWRQIHTPTAPSPRTMHGLCHDVLRGRTVLVGGWNLSATETWEYDGADWTQVVTTREPTALGGYARHASAFDQARGRVVMFDAFDTWELTPPEVATFASHGTGCAGSAGVPVLAADPKVPPALGARFPMTIAPVPSAPGVVLVAFGTDLVQWRGVRLPIDFGSPSCHLWIGPESGANLLVAHSGRVVDFAIQIPSTRALVGVVIGTQALVADAAAPNGIGALTNAGVLRLY